MKKDKETILKAISQAVKKEKLLRGSCEEKQKKCIKAKVIDFSDIKKTKWDIKPSLLNWTNRDFALYIIQKYEEKFEADIQLNIVGMITYLNNIKDAIVELLGFCDNVVFYDYVNYYFEEFVDGFVYSNKGNFSLHTMKFKVPIESFVSNYDYKSSINNKTRESVMKDKNDCSSSDCCYMIKEENLENSYLLGIESLLMDYGVVAPFNWMVNNKHMSKENVVVYMVNGLKELKKRCLINVVIKSNNQYGPYPRSFLIKDVLKIIFDMDDRVDLMGLEENYDSKSNNLLWSFIKRKC